MAKKIATVDLGTSSLRTTFWSLNGNVISQAVCNYPIHRSKPDYAEQDPQDWWKAFEFTFKKAAGAYTKDVEAITIASQREGVVPVDNLGRALSSCIIWMDNRTGPQLEMVRATFTDSEINQITGLRPAIYYSACKILWIMQHQKSIHKKAMCYLQPGEYLAMQLSGKPIADLSLASRTMLLDVRKRKWSKKISDGLGISLCKLPTLVESGSVVGYVKKDVANKLGLCEGTKVLSGGGDQQCGAVGCGAINEKIASVSLGTSTTVSMSINKLKLSTKSTLPCCISAVPGLWELEPSIWSSGSILTWLDGRLNHKKSDIETLIREAQKVPVGSEGLMLVPYFMGAGSPNWNPRARGAFVGLTLGHTNGHLTRAVLEGNAFDIRMNLESLNADGFCLKRLVVNGGGAKSELWCQIIADITGLRVEVPRITEAVSFGLFLMAHVSLGYSRSIKQAAQKFIKIDHFYEPNNKRHKKYLNLYDKFKELVIILDWFYKYDLFQKQIVRLRC